MRTYSLLGESSSIAEFGAILLTEPAELGSAGARARGAPAVSSRGHSRSDAHVPHAFFIQAYTENHTVSHILDAVCTNLKS